MKTACVLRWGAFGDCIQATPIFPLLKQDGYKVAFHTKAKGVDMVRHNPHIDKVIVHNDDSLRGRKAEEYWEFIGSCFDRFINLSGSIEERLLISGKPGWEKELSWSKEKRHEYCNINYAEHTLKVAGYPNAEINNGELYFSRLEEAIAKKWRKKHGDKFIVLWAISGSAIHKIYPYTEYVVKHLLDRFEDMMVVFVGDALCEFIEAGMYDHPRVKGYSGKFPIRRSVLLTRYVDLVVGPETGILNAAACYDTPKIVLLSHSTPENLTKHWTNTVAIEPDVDCYPCHILHFNMDYCHRDEKLGSPVCMAKLPIESVLEPIINEYENRRYNHGVVHTA